MAGRGGVALDRRAARYLERWTLEDLGLAFGELRCWNLVADGRVRGLGAEEEVNEDERYAGVQGRSNEGLEIPQAMVAMR